MAFRQRLRLLRPVLYTASGASLLGGGALYITYRPRTIPGSEPAAVPPPTYGSSGVIEPPTFPDIKTREQQISDLKRSSAANYRASTSTTATSSNEDDPYDLLVIGGGATGAGVALDAATRGLRVALVERDDFGSGTSSKSTKLVHGGIRYLEKAVWELDYSQYKLVREALRERRIFLDTAPHLSQWLPIMVPIDKWWKVPYFWAGTKAYDLLAGSNNIESSYFLSLSKAIEAFPTLKKENLVGALVYYDGAHNDSRMNVSLATTAALYGATTVNHLEVTGLCKDSKGALNGARVKDLIPGRSGDSSEEFNIRAKGVINATGPFIDGVRKLDSPDHQEIVAPSSGVHVILPDYYGPSDIGLIDPSTSDGRVVFFLPWQGNILAGTTDTSASVQHNPIASEEDINWILKEVQNYLSPDLEVRRSDVLASWSGIRPLVRDPKAKKTEGLVRNHLLTTSDSGLLTISGGKWTTYRQMAKETVDEAIKLFHLQPKPIASLPNIAGTENSDHIVAKPALDGTCQTHRVKLVGAHGFSKTLFINLIQHFGLETDVAKHLAIGYGDRAWKVAALCSPTGARFPTRGKLLSALYPYVDGEVRYACRYEYAQTAVDVVARRTRLAFLNAQATLEALPAVIDIMSAELGWSKARRDGEWESAVEFLGSMGLPREKMAISRREVEDGQSRAQRGDADKMQVATLIAQ